MRPMQSRASEGAPLADSEPAATAEHREALARVHELYREHSPRLVRQLARRTGCSDLARELAQEVFVRLLRMAPASLGRIQQPEAFLRQVSTNLLRDWGRAAAVKQRSQPTLALARDDHVDQVAVLETRDTLRRLEHAIGKLKPKTRDIFIAHRIHGLTYAEIADRTGLSVKGVEKHMTKAIAKVDQLLDRE